MSVLALDVLRTKELSTDEAVALHVPIHKNKDRGADVVSLVVKASYLEQCLSTIVA